MVVIPLFAVFSGSNLGDIDSKYLTFMYFTVMTSSMIPLVISTGNNSQTIWLYRSIPTLRPSSVLSNAVKAAFGRYFIPVFIVMTLPLFYLKGAFAIADSVTIFLFNYVMAYSILYFQLPIMPFSQTKAATQGGKMALRMILIIFIAIPVGFLHSYLSGKNGWFGALPIVLFLPVLLLFDKKWFPEKVTWKQVEMENKV
jgi:hypothetical protein